ncbi:hypothetical protein FQN57_002191 [Myotisia sp. PD_48]|nr:hypothetical protein FQN57_002191 [Myotisia sp. PD_48]
MAAGSPSTHFLHLANVWRRLSLRSDIDDIILELLGRFALDRIYADTDSEKFQRLVSNLLSQLNAIIYIQRMSIPQDRHQVDLYLAFLANWELIARTIEFVLQVVIEGREILWAAHPLLDRQLGDLVSTALRILSLHPKEPPRAQDRKDRFSRIHTLLERLFDGYPGPRPFLLAVSRDIAEVLRTEPNSIALPVRLRAELPNIALDLYPLPACLSDRYVSTIVDGAGSWLAQFLALRDVTQFVVGACVQYAASGETQDLHLKASCSMTRNAVLGSLDKLRTPKNFPRVELQATFSQAFRIILPDTPAIASASTSGIFGDGQGVEAIQAFCLSLANRQVIHRASDEAVIRAITNITKRISLLDDPSGESAATYPRVYALNCRSCHLAGETQLRVLEDLEFPSPEQGPEIGLPTDTKCVHCGQIVTLAREIPLARETWALLNCINFRAERLSEQRHDSPPFQLSPPKITSETPNAYPYPPKHVIDSPTSFRRSPSDNYPPVSPGPDPFGQEPTSAPITEVVSPYEDTPQNPFAFPPPVRTGQQQEVGTQQKPRAGAQMATQPPQTSPSLQHRIMHPEKPKIKWKFISKRDHHSKTADTTSSSSGSLENLKPEEICLKSLISPAKSQGKGKGAKMMVNVYLSQNSTHALFWTPPIIQVWDVGGSPASLSRIIPTDGSCLLAAVTRRYLAYIVASSDQKLSLRIVDLTRQASQPLQYQMPSSPWCKSIAISPLETYVVVGFENALVRYFKASGPEPQKELRLHHRYHAKCNALCPSVDTLAFSNDGEVLIASTRQSTTGVIKTFRQRAQNPTFEELSGCHYNVPLHESEDNGVSAAVYRPGTHGEEDLVCLTTWTQSGTPILMQPENGHKIEIKSDSSGHQRRLGNRIQSATFSLSGRLLGMVNDRGHLYLVSNLNSSIMEARRLATSKELTTKSLSFAMSFMILHEDESIVLAWTDSQKCMGYVKRIPIPIAHSESSLSATTDVEQIFTPMELPGDSGTGSSGGLHSMSDRSAEGHDGGVPLPIRRRDELSATSRQPVELAATECLVSTKIVD